MFAANGCAAFRSESELDSALAELETLVKSIDGDTDDRLVVIAGQISEESRSLSDAQDQFAREFNRQAADRDVSDDTLTQLVMDHDANRLELRNQLLRSQDELYRAVPKDAWPEVLEVLNRKQRARVLRRAPEV